MNPYYKDYAEYLAEIFPGKKLQKLSVNTGGGCPNRDGTLGAGGCIYCNNRSFTPAYCFGISGVRAQLEAGKRFFRRKYRDMEYLAYFQSFTSTYGSGLAANLDEAMAIEGIRGVVIGGRPDCLGDEVLDILRRAGEMMPIFVEIGVETLHDATLARIHRGHDAATAVKAIERTAAAGLHTGVHLIAGLPGETREMMLETIDGICGLPVESIKMHHLQVLRGSQLHVMVERGEVEIAPWKPEEYLEFCCDVVARIPEHIAVERFLAQAPPEMVVAPRWNIRNYEFVHRLHKQLDLRNAH